MLTFSTTVVLEAESAVVRDMLLMLVVLERLQLVVGFLIGLGTGQFFRYDIRIYTN